MFKNVKTKIAGLALAGAAAANAAAPTYLGTADSVSGQFEDVLSFGAPVAIAVVVGVAGVRVVIKLINRGAGK